MPRGTAFSARDERRMEAVAAHLGHTLSKLEPELALDDDRDRRAVPAWKVNHPLEVRPVSAVTVPIEAAWKRGLLGATEAAAIGAAGAGSRGAAPESVRPAMAAPPVPTTPAEFDKFTREEIARWSKAVKEYNIQPDF